MKIYCETHALLANQPTLFIHGNLASAAWWKPTVHEWTRQGSLGSESLYLADIRGCGHNPDWPSQQPLELDDLANDFFELLDEKGLRRPIALVGHSLGGLVALKMLATQPQRFSRAALLDPVGAQGIIFDPAMYDAFQQMAKSRELTANVILAFVKDPNIIGDLLKKQIEDDAFKAVQGVGWAVLQMLKTVDIRESLSKISVPTLVLHGARDQIIPERDAHQLAELLPQGRLEILPDNGHCWNIEDPKAFVHRLREWL